MCSAETIQLYALPRVGCPREALAAEKALCADIVSPDDLCRFPEGSDLRGRHPPVFDILEPLHPCQRLPRVRFGHLVLWSEPVGDLRESVLERARWWESGFHRD